jgi:hypothetical protein
MGFQPMFCGVTQGLRRRLESREDLRRTPFLSTQPMGWEPMILRETMLKKDHE